MSYEEEAGLEAGGFGGLLGVARGSAEPPRLLRVTYEPTEPSAVTVALVGKGVTFDSGGLVAKDRRRNGDDEDGHERSRRGASGVARVSSCRSLGSGGRLHAAHPGEHARRGRATKPGDVLKIRNGKTIEVIDTDAEGRLILADALSLAEEDHPDAIIDLADAHRSLRRRHSGSGYCRAHRQRRPSHRCARRYGDILRRPASRSGRCRCQAAIALALIRRWPTCAISQGAVRVPARSPPLWFLKNSSGITPWAHLDIAGPARASEDQVLFHQRRDRIRHPRH